MPRIAAVVHAFNEERQIARCLDGLTWTDDLLFIDTWSTDRTLEIARAYTDRTVQMRYVNAAATKNWAIEHAPDCDWLFFVDADEVVDAALAGEIRNAVRDTAHAGFAVNILTCFGGRPSRSTHWNPNYQVRLFRKGRGRWTDREVHARFRLDGTAVRLEHPIRHHPYPDLATCLAKLNRYTTFESRQKQREDRHLSPGEFPVKSLVRSVLLFLRLYLKHRGYRDGRWGLTVSLVSALYPFLSDAKYRVLLKRRKKVPERTKPIAKPIRHSALTRPATPSVSPPRTVGHSFQWNHKDDSRCASPGRRLRPRFSFPPFSLIVQRKWGRRRHGGERGGIVKRLLSPCMNALDRKLKDLIANRFTCRLAAADPTGLVESVLFSWRLDLLHRYRAIRGALFPGGRERPRRILDVGGGSGKIAEFIDPARHTLFVLDRRKNAIRSLPPGLRGVVGDMVHLPFRTASVHAAVSSDAVEHVPAEVRAHGLREMRRVASEAVVVHCPLQQEEEGFVARACDLRFNAAHLRLFGREEPNIREHLDTQTPTVDQIRRVLPRVRVRGTQNASVWYYCLLLGRVPFLGLLVGPVYRIFFTRFNYRPPYYTGLLVEFVREARS